jgi:hypothetical protein
MSAAAPGSRRTERNTRETIDQSRSTSSSRWTTSAARSSSFSTSAVTLSASIVVATSRIRVMALCSDSSEESSRSCRRTRSDVSPMTSSPTSDWTASRMVRRWAAVTREDFSVMMSKPLTYIVTTARIRLCPSSPLMSSVPSTFSSSRRGVRRSASSSGWNSTTLPPLTPFSVAQSFGRETVNVDPPVTCTLRVSMGGIGRAPP